MTTQPLKNPLIRAYSMDMRRNHGNVVVSEINFRRITFYPLTKPGSSANVPGAVLIDDGAALAPLGGAVMRDIAFLVMVYTTDELLWVPVRAEQDITEYWTIEMVPWVEYLRASAVADEEIIRRAHQE